MDSMLKQVAEFQLNRVAHKLTFGLVLLLGGHIVIYFRIKSISNFYRF